MQQILFNKICFSLTLLFLSLNSAIAVKIKKELPLVPYPKSLELKKGTFTPNNNLIFTYDKSEKSIHQTAHTCADDFSALGYTVAHNKRVLREKDLEIKLILNDEKQLGDEGYKLNTLGNISITANNNNGLFWGTRTLLQLLANGPGKPVPHLEIKDSPEFEYRGLMVDNARHFHSIEFHLKTIKKIASYKLNKYQIHFSDHQSYTLPSDLFPSLPTKGRHYTKKEVKLLVETAKKYHVEIIPEIDVPGHAGALNRSLNLRCKGGGHRKLCIGKEETYKALEKLFAEVMAMIPGKYWHLGADEVHYDGKSCTDCVAGMQKKGFKTGDQLFNNFINRMHNLIKADGRKMLVWEGFNPKVSPLVHKDIIVCPFDIKHKGRMPNHYFEAGYKLLNTSWTPLYVADNIYVTTPEIIAKWSPYMFGAGRSPQPYAYWKKYNPDQYKGIILGAQMCSWDIEEKAEEGLLFGSGPGFHNYGRPGPRVQIMAERVWTGSATSPKSLLERVHAHYW